MATKVREPVYPRHPRHTRNLLRIPTPSIRGYPISDDRRSDSARVRSAPLRHRKAATFTAIAARQQPRPQSVRTYVKLAPPGLYTVLHVEPQLCSSISKKRDKSPRAPLTPTYSTRHPSPQFPPSPHCTRQHFRALLG